MHYDQIEAWFSELCLVGWKPLIFDVSGAHRDDDQHQNDAAYSKSVDKNVFHLSHLLSQKVSSKQRATLALRRTSSKS